MIEIDNTARVLFDTCPQKYYQRIIRKRVPLEPKSLAPYFGAAIHRGAEQLYRGGGQKEVMEAFATEYSKWWNPNIDSERSIENGYIVLENFIKRFNPAEDYLKTLTINNQLALEVGFSVAINEEVVFSGRIDRIAGWGQEIVIEDWKTSRYVGSSYLIAKPNDQFTGYSFGASDILGVQIKTIFITQIGTYVKKQVKEFDDEGRVKVRKLTSNDERVDLARITTTRTAEDYADWKRRLLLTVGGIEWSTNEGYWPMQTHSCPSFQGCEYLPICSAQEEARESIAATLFKEEEWRAYESIE